MGFPPYGFNLNQQNMQPPMMQAQPQTQQVTDAWVMSEDEAKAFRVMPNCTVRLWHMNETIFWVKQADAMGRQSMTRFHYKEDVDIENAPVTRKEFEELSAKIDRLTEGKKEEEA